MCDDDENVRCNEDCAIDPTGRKWHYPPCPKAGGSRDCRVN